MAEIDWKKLTGALDFDEQVMRSFQLLKEKNSRVTNLNVGGVARTLNLELPSQALADLQALLLEVMPQGFVMHATGGWLDLCAQDMNVYRRAELQARGLVTFTRSRENTGNIRIPKGTIVKTPIGPDGRELRFFVTSEVVMLAKDDSCDVPVEAEHPGAAYSVGAGYITELVTHVAGIASIMNGESWLTQEGADTESDDDLRARCVLRWHELSQGSTKYAYQSWALSVKGVREAYILDQHPRGQGTVDVVIVGTGGAPSESLIQEVQKVIDEHRPVCSDALVRAPKIRGVQLDIEVFIHPSEGDEAAIKNDCMAALDALFARDSLYPHITPFAIGEDVTMARIIHAIMGLKHVLNVTVYAPNDDVRIEADELAVKSGVAVQITRLDEV